MAQNENTGIYIKITENGPYLVYGDIPIMQEIITENDDGHPWEHEQGQTFKKPDNGKAYVALCRCGQSKHAPFCDGIHEKIDFEGTTTAPFKPIEKDARRYTGEKYTLLDNEAYCAFARFCDAYGQIWNLIEQAGERAENLVLREAAHCPAGRLMIKENATGKSVEPKFSKSVGVLEDPQAGCSGPLFIKGGITIEDEHGRKYEIRNRVTLCRCGQSENKPFCNGIHAEIAYQDGIDGQKTLRKKRDVTPRPQTHSR